MHEPMVLGMTLNAFSLPEPLFYHIISFISCAVECLQLGKLSDWTTGFVWDRV